MTSLLDINAWVYLAFQSFPQHPAALRWFRSQSPDSVAFCRTTQLGFLRLSTNSHVAGADVASMDEAWVMYDDFLTDPHVLVLPEPPGTEAKLRKFASGTKSSPKLWMDAYLAAFAIESGCQLVTFDTGFHQFPGLNLLLLS